MNPILGRGQEKEEHKLRLCGRHYPPCRAVTRLNWETAFAYGPYLTTPRMTGLGGSCRPPNLCHDQPSPSPSSLPPKPMCHTSLISRGGYWLGRVLCPFRPRLLHCAQGRPRMRPPAPWIPRSSETGRHAYTYHASVSFARSPLVSVRTVYSRFSSWVS